MSREWIRGHHDCLHARNDQHQRPRPILKGAVTGADLHRSPSHRNTRHREAQRYSTCKPTVDSAAAMPSAAEKLSLEPPASWFEIRGLVEGCLLCSPRPSCDAPTGSAFLQGQCKYSRILHVLPALLVRKIHGNDDIRSICSDIDVPWLHERS